MIFKGFFKQFIASFLLVTLLVSNFSTVTVFGADPVVDGSFNLSIDKLSDSNGRADLSLNWDEMKFLGKEDGTRYYIYRKDLLTGNWEARGRYGDAIKVLNVYPDIAGSDQLKSWMDALSAVNENVNIDVDKVKITDFNNAPSSYLNTNEFGTYNYDVVVFGFWDSNYGKDLNPASVAVIDDFIDNDGGVIFGHDTMETNTKKPYFKQVVEDKTSMRASQTPGTTWPNWLYSYKIKIEKQGSVTTYPCDINGMSLIIPYSHTVGQIPTNPDAVYMGFEKYSKEEVKKADPNLDVDTVDQYKSPNGTTDNTDKHYLSYFYKGSDKKTATEDVYLDYNGVSYNTNAYLTVEDNVAFIQCGHSSGKTNTAEQMVLANTIYALAKIFTGTKAKDQILDIAPPTKPTHTIENDLISFASTDTGSTFEYRVVAIPMGVEESVRNSSDQILAAIDDPTALGIGDSIKFSNTVSVSVTGGLQKFRYNIDTVTSPSVKVDDTSVALDGTIPVPENSTSDTYIHVAAYDKANNVSKMHSFRLWDYLSTYNVTEKFVDIDTGLEFQPEVLTQQLDGSLYTPIPEKTIKVNDRLTYEFVNSNPTKVTVTSDESKNIITHYYKSVNYPLVTERFVVNVTDSNGNIIAQKELKAPITTYVKEGTKYTPKADVYKTESIIQENGEDRYFFSNTDLYNGVTVSTDETKNVITHYYVELLTKTINVVEHQTYPTVSSNIYPLSQDVVLKQGENASISLPVLANHNFDGYYTIGAPEVNADGSNKVEVGSDLSSIDISWSNSAPIYLHYTRKVGSGTVKIVNSYTNLPITSFETPESNVGENLIITDEYIAEAPAGKDFSTYIDGYKLNEFISVPITNEGNNNTVTVELTPRKKTIIYYGLEVFAKVLNYIIDIFTPDENNSTNPDSNESTTSQSELNATTTSGSSVIVTGEYTELERESYTFGEANNNYNGVDTGFNLIDKKFNGWAILSESKNFFVNFSDPSTTNYVGYYREPKTTETYSYEVNYLNQYDNGTLVGQEYYTNVNALNKPTINIKTIKDLNINNNSVDFEPAYIKISHPTLGTQTFDFTENYLSFFNKVDASGNFITGHYVVDVYYKPYVTVNYVEEFLDTDLETIVSTKTTTVKTLYDDIQTIPYPETKFGYEYLLYKLNGTEVDHTKEYPSLLPNKYTQTIVATYRPIVYNLNVKAYTVASRPTPKASRLASVPSEGYYLSYTFNNVPATDIITISEPKFEGFNLQNLLGASDLGITATNGIVHIKADPQKVLTNMLSGTVPVYNVEAVYAKPSVLTVNHIDTNTNSTFKTETITSVVDADTSVPIYEDYKRQFSSATLVGDTQSIPYTKNAIIVRPTLETQTLNIYYVENTKYNLNVTCSTGGTLTGTTTGLYFENDTVSVTATPSNNYVFDRWEVSGISGLNTSSNSLSFNMPSNTVTLNAVFIPNNINSAIDDNDIDDDNTNNNNSNISSNIDKGINIVNQPEHNINEFNYWEYERTFKPYIYGYPDDTIGPNRNITRSEFIAIIYNLLGEEKESDLTCLKKFSDVSTNAWYSQALAFSIENGYINGYEDGTFRPNGEMTRAELAAVISRLYPDDNTPIVKTPFTDILDSWAKSSIEELYSKGVIVGSSKTTFTPRANATRAEVVTLVNRLIERPTDWKDNKHYPDLTPEHWAYNDMMNAANGGSYYDTAISEQLSK